MRLSAAWLLLLVVARPALASTVSDVRCQITGERESVCQIRLGGRVQAGERLYLTGVRESDQIYWENFRLGGTGVLFDRPFFAGILPRLYSLQPLEGQESPRLTLRARSIFARTAGIPVGARVRVVDTRYPLRKVLAPLYLPFGIFFAIALGWLCLVTWLRRQTIDGWVYPAPELRQFVGGLCAYLLLSQDVSRLLVPLLWSVDLHILAQRTTLLVCAWSHGALVAGGRFSDRSCVERGLSRPASPRLQAALSAAFLACLGALAASPQLRYGYFYLLLSLLSALLAWNSAAAAAGTEWRRVLKRSGTGPLLFHFALLAFPFALLAFAGGRYLSLFDGRGILGSAAALVLATGTWRLYRFQCVHRRGRELVAECREILLRHSGGADRLNALCEFFESEWGAARVSVISVENGQGLVLASAGPDAITAENRAEPRKLGPFLRRVCKEGHILYAPVAEELGKDLREKGLKHSSLALPLVQEGRARAVLCVMADEGERIRPLDASLMELVTEALGLEILSAVFQHIAEEKSARLIAISRSSGGLAMEHMDDWGYLRFSKSDDKRFLVGGDALPPHAAAGALRQSPVMGRLLAAYELELRSVWTALSETFEFLPKDVNGDFWVLSPRRFRQPFLQSLGSERSALLLAQCLDRAARGVAAKPGYLPLGLAEPKLIVGETRLRLVSYGSGDTGNVETDAADFSVLERLREDAPAGTLAYWGENPAGRLAGERFDCKTLATPLLDRLFTVIGVHGDKKEVRKLEARALEQARVRLRRVA